MGLFDGMAKGVNGFFGGGTPPPYQTPQRIQNFMQPISTTEMQAAGLDAIQWVSSMKPR